VADGKVTAPPPPVAAEKQKAATAAEESKALAVVESKFFVPDSLFIFQENNEKPN
jgi:hypothetical protein